MKKLLLIFLTRNYRRYQGGKGLMNFILAILIIFNAQFVWASAGRNFDGVDDRLGQGDIFNVTTGDISFCGFHKLTEDASIDQVVGKRTTTGDGWALIQSTADVMSCSFNGDIALRQS